jgi:hypothetical protein
LIVLPMSNCAPVLGVEGVELVEPGEAVDGAALLFLPPQPAIPNTTAAASAITNALWLRMFRLNSQPD